jgi:hypothetical protein
MSQAGETKRQNFNVSPEQEAQIEWLRQAMGVTWVVQFRQFMRTANNEPIFGTI